jgi:acyl-CoA thioesterase II
VDARAWLGLEPTHNPMRWTLPVTPGISTGHQFLFGGCGLGAAIEALEGTTGRPLVWATAQYLSYANPPEVLDIDVTVAVAGNQVTQARAVGHVADREVLTVNAALGKRDLDAEGQWAAPPEVPPPDECPARQLRFPGDDSIMARLDVRLASAHAMEDLPGPGMPGGRSALWARLPGEPVGQGPGAQRRDGDVLDPSAAALAILGDYVPFGIGQALGERAGGNSLDNTLRVARLVPTEWVLIDIRIDGVANGFGHGAVHLWAEDGTLLATASQSTIVRFWRD